MLGTRAQPSSCVRPIAVFDPLLWQIAPWKDRSPVILLTGSAGGGKSRLAAEKLHGYCLKYPGAFAILARKTRVSLTKGSILFLKETIIGRDPNVEHLESKDYFRYRNGSYLAYIGLEDEDQRERLKSIGPRGGADIVWGEEATELEEADHNALLARMRGIASSWRQLIYSCNPDAPTHWIKRRLIDGMEARVYYSSRHDNVHNPADYDRTMNLLTGIDDLRLNKGQWVQASGLVYDVWSDGPANGNVTEEAEYIPGGGSVYWAVDDGYSGERDPETGLFADKSSPRVFLLVQERPNGRLCVFAESYEVKMLEGEHIARVLLLPYTTDDTGKPTEGQSWMYWAMERRKQFADPAYAFPVYAAVDSAAAELRGQLHAAQIYTQGKPPTIEESIKPLRRMLAPDANGWRRILVHPRCRYLRSEMASYRRDPVTGKPIDAYNHGPDALRYLAWTKRQGA